MGCATGKRSIVVAGLLAVALAILGAPAASAHVVEVTTSVALDQVEDRAQLKEVIKAEIERIIATTIAFKPTVVALTDARQMGERLLVKLLIADAEGEQLIQELERGGSDGPGTDGPGVDPMRPREMRI